MANSEEATACVRYSPLHAGGNRMIHVLERPRDVVRTIVLAAAVAAAPAAAQAQDYPSQDIRFICGFPAGSGADVLVRYFAEKVRQVANRTIIVENKVGAAGNIAAIYTARAKPDGLPSTSTPPAPLPPTCICSRRRRSMPARTCR